VSGLWAVGVVISFHAFAATKNAILSEIHEQFRRILRIKDRRMDKRQAREGQAG
jgi:hypothetical protein